MWRYCANAYGPSDLIVVQQNKVELAASIVAALVKEAKQKDAITQAELDFVSMFFV